MRAAGIRGLLICCNDYRCSHSIAVNADQWPDETRLSDLEKQFTCSVCGRKGAELGRISIGTRSRRDRRDFGDVAVTDELL